MAGSLSETGCANNSELYHFRCSLLKVSQQLRSDEVRELVYICTEITCTENIAKGHDLFLDLEKNGLILPGNYDYLLDRLLQIGREDLVTYLMERICQSPRTQCDVANKMLNRLLKTGRDEVALHFLKWMCKSLHTPSTSHTHLMEHLINRGRGDLVMELMGRMSCLHLPRGLQSDQQTMQVVYHAKQSMCTSHKAALSMLSFTASSAQMNDTLTKFHQEVRKCVGMQPEAIFIQWSNFPVCKNFKEILSNTLECIYPFADAFRDIVTTINKAENVDVDRIRMSATTCNITFDDFNKVHAFTQWSPSEREAALRLRKTRNIPGSIHIQTAVRSISNICEGLLCRRMMEEAKAKINDRLFILETAMYVLWCAVPMHHWMRTIIQLAASSKLDLTMYQDIIVKVATEHREPIVQYHNELSQIIGRDAMRNIDSVLKINKLATSTSGITPKTASVQSNFDLEGYMVTNWYIYLLQLLVLACDSSPNSWEIASKTGEHHCSFHKKSHDKIRECGLENARKLFIAIHTEVENFKAELVHQCPESSAERMLLSGLLPPLTI